MPTALVWTPEEDEELQRLVDVHGSKKWALIATKLRSKSSKQCRRRWKNFLSINAKTCTWSAEEDAQLMAAHAELGNRWTEISRIFGDRTDNAVKNRWHALVRKHPALTEEGGDAKRARHSAPLLPQQQHHHHDGHRRVQSMGGNSVLPSPFEQNSTADGAVSPPLRPTLPPHAPLAIQVSRELLSPWEMQLAAQVNAMDAPIHIELMPHEAMMGGQAQYQYKVPELATDPLAVRTSWRQLVEIGGMEAPSAEVGGGITDIVSWLSHSSIPDLAPQESRRLTRRASREAAAAGHPGLVANGGAGGSPGVFTEEHRSLLRRLMSRGMEARGSWDVARLLSIDLEAGAGAAAGGVGQGADAGCRVGSETRSPRSDPLLRTRASWRRGGVGSLGMSPELTPTTSFEFFQGASGQQLAHRLRMGSGTMPSGTSALGFEGGVHLNPTFSSAELQLLVDTLLPKPSMAR